MADQNETAYFAGGSFWAVEEAFRNMPGVISTETGYTGGTTENPTYESVCSDETGHAEAVKVVFNPKIVNYRVLVEHFFRTHDPTTRNRQGPDYGMQYRSMICTTSKEQEDIARQAVQELTEDLPFGSRQIVTEIIPAGPFYRAEEYHQRTVERAVKEKAPVTSE